MSGREGRGAGGGLARAPRGGGRALVAGLFTTLALAAAASASAPEVEPVVVRDAQDAVTRGLDLTRAQLGLARDRRLRAALTLVAPWRARDLRAGDGPPGSLCLRLWTRTKPGGAPPDFLVCVTARNRGDRLRGSVLEERAEALPRRVADAAVARRSERTVIVRFSQSALGRPATIRFTAEATKPGCPRVTCVDTAPDAPRTATLRVRSR